MTSPSTLERAGVCLPNTARSFFTFFERLDSNIFKANAIELFKKYRIRIISGGDDLQESLVTKDSSIILLLALKINFKKLPKIISRYVYPLINPQTSIF